MKKYTRGDEQEKSCFRSRFASELAGALLGASLILSGNEAYGQLPLSSALEGVSRAPWVKPEDRRALEAGAAYQRGVEQNIAAEKAKRAREEEEKEHAEIKRNQEKIMALTEENNRLRREVNGGNNSGNVGNGYRAPGNSGEGQNANASKSYEQQNQAPAYVAPKPDVHDDKYWAYKKGEIEFILSDKELTEEELFKMKPEYPIGEPSSHKFSRKSKIRAYLVFKNCEPGKLQLRVVGPEIPMSWSKDFEVGASNYIIKVSGETPEEQKNFDKKFFGKGFFGYTKGEYTAWMYRFDEKEHRIRGNLCIIEE